MTDIVVGILAVAAGIMLCLAGYWTLRLLLSIWGGVVGFGVGSTLGTWINDDSYLASALGWIVGLALALIFAVLAYLYYAVAIVLSLGTMGFTIGAAVTAAVGVSWDWVIVSIGLVCGLLLALLAIAARIPMLLLVALSSLGGATIAVTGLMLLTGALDTADFDSATVTETIDERWWWSLALIVLAVCGFVAQLRRVHEIDSIRQGWAHTAAGSTSA